jgi:apolipoprotein D and lipocalin family protein
MAFSIKGIALKLALGWATLGFAAPSALQAAELETVPFVDVQRYLGKWFEVARLPQVFQTGCTGVTAEYSLNEDGSVRVSNFCRILDPQRGFPISITGRAVPSDETNSKLDVTFFNGAAQGKYWVLELDANYQWALVGDPDRSSLYILSRTPTLDDAIYQELLDLAVTKHGYDISRLIKTRQ